MVKTDDDDDADDDDEDDAYGVISVKTERV